MVAMDGLQALNDERARFKDPYDDRYSNSWEGVSLKPFNTNDEYLYAMREDLAEWLNSLYDIEIPPESFFDRLESGALLCKHANNVRRYALDFHFRDSPGDEEVEFVHGIFVKHPDLQYKREAKSGTFFARDNISNFIYWCRHSLRINEVLLFESDDLVLRKNDKSFILCLLEVARRGGPIGMPVPMLVQLEQEIDRELNAGTPSEAGSLASTDSTNPCSETTTDVEAEAESEAESDGKPMDYASSPSPEPSSTSKPRKPKESAKPKNTCRPRARNTSSKLKTDPENQEPFKRIMLTEEVLKTLDELVREQVNRCSCPVQFPMIRIAEGKYRIGDSNTLIFVRILRKHVMVRVGGGWDTLTHYLDKHDPCRCHVHKKGQRRSTAGADFGPRSPKRRSSVKPVDVLQALNGHASSDGTSSPTDTATTRSDSPPTSPRRTAPRPEPRPRSAVNPGGISRRQSSGDVYRPSSLHLDVRHSPRNSPRPLRRGQSFDCTSPRFVTSPDSSDTYSNSDVAEAAVTPTKDATLKRCQGKQDLSERRTTTPDSDITTCSEPVPAMTASPLRRRNSTRVSSSLSSSVGTNRTSQTATEEFLRRKRQQARAQSVQVNDVKRKSEQVIQSAPASPTRQHNSPSLLNKQRSTSKTHGDSMRRTSVGTASEERRCNTLGRDTRRKSMVDAKRSSLSRDASMSPSISRRSLTPSSISRTARPQSCQSARTTKDDRRRSSQSGETVMMIQRGDDGRHRLDSESSCESNDSSIKSGSRSLTGVPARRLSEAGGAKNRYRSISVERSNDVAEKHGTAGERRRSLMDKTNTDRKKTATNNHRRMSSVERPSPQVQPRSRSLSREWQTSSLRLPKNSSARRPYGGSASATGSPVRRRRSDIPLCSNLLANSWDQTDGRDGSISSGASSPIGGAAAHPFTSPNSSKSSNSRLKPPTAIPAHLKPDHSVMTSLRNDFHRDSRPSRIPLPAGHKRLLEAQHRSNSLPDILAELLKAWQTVQNSTMEMNQMDPYDLSPCRSSEGGSVSPTTSVRTAPDLNDSGYEDNATLKITSPNVVANHLPVLPSIDSANNN